jgi:hypothetical protein
LIFDIYINSAILALRAGFLLLKAPLGVSTMRTKIIASAAALFIGGAGVLTLAVPAFAATASNSPVTVEVTGGALSISAPTQSVDLGSRVSSASAQTVSAQLGNVAVTDNRAGTVGWTATASATDFTGPQTISTTTFGLVVYTAPQATVTGTATVTPSTESTLNTGGPVQGATNVSGSNTATWSPTIAVTIPANALAGTYSTSITHSVA